MGQHLPHEQGRGRVRGGNREVPPARSACPRSGPVEGVWGNREVPPGRPVAGPWGKRSFPPRERAVGERRSSSATLSRMVVHSPRTLDEALRLKAEQPDSVPIEGGTDVMVELNFDRARPSALIDLNRVGELAGWSHEDGALRLGASLTYTEAMRDPLAARLPALAEASRTVGSPQIRNRGAIGGNLGTASPAGDALPPLLIEG